MIMSETLSNAPTVAPNDSASNVQAPKPAEPAQSGGKARGKRSSKNAIAKDTPQGAVQVPAPGKPKAGDASKLTNATIPLTGWADLDLTATRVETIPTYTVDVNPFVDLIKTEFDRIHARSPSTGKHIPFALFQYYCLELFWFRVLTLFKANGQTLSKDQKDFLNAFSGGEEFVIPTHIAQYLANIGNFMQGAETYYFRTLDISFSGRTEDHNVKEGWVDCGNQTTRVTTGDQFWSYAQVPVPGIFVTTVMNEIAFNDPANPGFNDLDHVTPTPGPDHRWLPSPNIAGWINNDYHHRFAHSSWRSTYYNLGWTDWSAPTDMQTNYKFSASSMRWMSERLATIKELKVHSSKQLSLSVNGNPIQAYWIEEPDKFHSYDHPEYAEEPIREKASQFTEMALTSRFSIDPRALTPSFDFGYRIARSKVITGYANRQPIYAERSNFQPWIYTTEEDSPRVADPPPHFLVGMNRTWTFGSSNNLNLVRFQTPTMRRDLALQNSLLLVNQ